MKQTSKTIGGYFELTCYGSTPLHPDAVYLNSGRNALRYIVRNLGIKKIHIPYYTCSVVEDALSAEGCHIIPYELDNSFYPAVSFEKNDFILYTNYFGICGKNITELSAHYPNLVVDNAQAFYSGRQGRASFSSPRKFFGLPDGGLAFLDSDNLNLHLEKSVSYDLCSSLLKRYDLGAEGGYADFRETAATIAQRPVQIMSDLTTALMSNLPYEQAKKQRLENFAFLQQALADYNILPISPAQTDVPMVYPLLTDNPKLRTRLIDNRIFVATYWPQKQGYITMSSPQAVALADKIIPLPIDQRYQIQDMQRILEVICK